MCPPDQSGLVASSRARRGCAGSVAGKASSGNGRSVLISAEGRNVSDAPYKVRYWTTTSKVASTPSRYGQLVRLADVQKMAAQAQAQRPLQQD
jgi:hypothetical protein